MRILFVGDLHANTNNLLLGLEKAKEEKCELIIQVGDFGFFPRLEEYKDYFSVMQSEIPFWFIDGNHEDHEILGSWHDATEIISVNTIGEKTNLEILNRTKNFYYVPRGYVTQLGNTIVGFMGGANSIDSHLRKEGIDWFSNETISQRQFYSADFSTVDILISHEAAYKYILKGEEPNSSRLAIQSLFDSINPNGKQTNIHGHHHHSYTHKVLNQTYIGLGCKPKDMFLSFDL
jgi:Icc-related predicted phosphoesterase